MDYFWGDNDSDGLVTAKAHGLKCQLVASVSQPQTAQLYD